MPEERRQKNMEISIRKFGKEDIENKVKWINNPQNNTYLHYDLPLVYDKTLLWFRRIQNQTDRYDAVIEADGVPIGLIGLLQIDKRNQKSEFYIALGEEAYKGKGIAFEASKILLAHAFCDLQLNKVYLYTETDNRAAQKLFEKLGFQKEGLLKEDLIYNERKVDRFFYGITKKEFLHNSVSDSKDIG